MRFVGTTDGQITAHACLGHVTQEGPVRGTNPTLSVHLPVCITQYALPSTSPHFPFTSTLSLNNMLHTSLPGTHSHIHALPPLSLQYATANIYNKRVPKKQCPKPPHPLSLVKIPLLLSRACFRTHLDGPRLHYLSFGDAHFAF